jgi:hypothetical protein
MVKLMQRTQQPAKGLHAAHLLCFIGAGNFFVEQTPVLQICVFNVNKRALITGLTSKKQMFVSNKRAVILI